MENLSIDCRGWGAILHEKWVSDLNKNDTIIGFWAEDYSNYRIIVPAQLRDIIIDIQNWLSDIYKKYYEFKIKIEKIQKFFDERG